MMKKLPISKKLGLINSRLIYMTPTTGLESKCCPKSLVRTT